MQSMVGSRRQGSDELFAAGAAVSDNRSRPGTGSVSGDLGRWKRELNRTPQPLALRDES